MNKRIFISGASKGIGIAIARIFYANTYEVIICARGHDGLHLAKSEMPNLITYICDISDKVQVKTLAKTIKEEHGPLDILVNNGGTFIPGVTHEEDDSLLETLISTNLFSAYYFSKAFIPDMKIRRKGHIFNVCSVASLAAYPNGGSYSISKFAMLGLSKVLRAELAEFGIGVTSILPGAVKTPAWDGVEIPSERFIPPQDIGKLIWDVSQLSDRTVVEELVVAPSWEISSLAKDLPMGY